MTVGVIDPYASDSGPLGIGECLQKCVGDGQRIYKGIRVRPTAELGDVDGREHRRVGNGTTMHMHFDDGTEGQCGAMFDDARHAENPLRSNLSNSDRIEYLIKHIIGIDTLTSNGVAHVLIWAMKPITYARHRFPPDVIRHAVWLYLRFTLSYRDVEDLLAERGLMISNESIRRWVLKFGPIVARNLRKIRPKAYTRWHLDEMVVSIAGRQMYMWRAAYGEGEVLEILVQPKRDKAAAVRLLRKLLRRQGFVPIARRTRIGRFVDANKKCKALNQPTRRSGSLHSTRRFTTHSTCNGI
jgi:transposase-like protein